MFSVYAIYNEVHDNIYIGQTNNIIDRLNLHNTGTFKGYTSRYKGEWIIVHQEQFQTRAEALIRERQLKSFRGREFVRNKIKNIPLVPSADGSAVE